MSKLSLLALTVVLLGAPSAIASSTATTATCPMPCGAGCVVPVEACDVPCDLPCAAGAEETTTASR